jgi:hypothetical protein
MSFARVRSLLLAILGLLFVASWPGAAVRELVLELTAPALPKEIEGRDGVLDVIVTTKDEGHPIAHARVRAFAILDGRAHAAAEATSDEGGRATLRALPQAEHWIVAEAEGRARASQMVVIVAGARRLDLALGPEHVLDVEVKTEQGAPVSGAEIEARSGGDPFPVGGRSAENGLAHVGRLAEGPFTVIVRAPGYEEVTRRRVPEGEKLVVTLGKQGALVVKVIGADGQPAPQARVLVASPTLWPARLAETGADGSVRIAGLASGTYALRATKGSLVSPIELGVSIAKSEQKEVELRLGPGVSIVCRVVDATNDDGVANAKVSLAENGISPFPIEGVTDKTGRVVLGPIARGPSSLSARADGFVPKSAMRIDEDPPPEVKVPLMRGGVLLGKVTDTRGYSVDGATIRVVGTDIEGMPIDEDPQRSSFREAHFTATLGGPSPLIPAGELGVMPGPVPPIPHGPSLGASALPYAQSQARTASEEPWVTGRDGMFRASPVTPGRVRAYVRHPQYVEAMSDVVLLAPDKEARVDVVLQRGGNVEGRVVDVKRRPVVGALVTMLATRGSFERVTRTGTDGSFAFAAVPDAVTILVSPPDEEPTVIAARVELVVPEAGKKTIEIVLPEPRPPLLVKVTGDRGSPVDAAQITAVSLDPQEALRVTAFTDARGEAQLRDAKGVALRVEVHAPGRAARILTTTPETQRLDVALGSAESVSGEVTTKRRDGIEGAEVVLQTETGVRHARTGKDGTFTVNDVAPGPARLRVRASGRAPVTREITIEQKGGRKPTEVPRIELMEEGIVEGIVVDGRGDPVPGARIAKDAVPTYLPVGAPLVGMAVADAKGRFKLGELSEGMIVLEAYAADVGRARRENVKVNAGRTTSDVKIVIVKGDPGAKEPMATGGVAVTLGETVAGLEGPEVVIVAVSENSEAERAGLQANDIVLEIAGAKPANIVEARTRLAGPVHDDVVVKVRRGERILALRIPREAVRR